MKAIEEKGDLPDVFNSVRAELEKLSGKLGEPVNTMGSMEQEKPEQPPEQAATLAPQPPAGTSPAGPPPAAPPQTGMPGQ